MPVQSAAPAPQRPAVFRQHLPGQAPLAREASQWKERGVAAYLPPGARPYGDANVFDHVAQLAIPLVVTDRFPLDAPAAFFSMHALADRQFAPRLRQFLGRGGRALMTSHLAARVGGLARRYADRIFILNTEGGPERVLRMPQTGIDSARNFVLHPLGLRIQAPPKVALSLHGEQAILVENFNTFAAGLKLTFRRPPWPEIAEIQTADGEAAVRVTSNLAQVQVAPRSARLLRLVAREGR